MPATVGQEKERVLEGFSTQLFTIPGAIVGLGVFVAVLTPCGFLRAILSVGLAMAVTYAVIALSDFLRG